MKDNTNRRPTLFVYMESLIAIFQKSGRFRTAETHGSTMRSIRSFLGGRDIAFSRLNANLLEQYQAWMLQRGISRNTISFYMRVLRSVLHRAVADGITRKGDDIFSHVYTGIPPTRKRALSIESIRKIRDFKLPADTPLAFARDMFMLSFYLRGMSFIDMAYLRKKDFHCTHLTYCRRKTHRPLTIAWTAEMQAILDRYPRNPSEFLLPILTDTAVDLRRQCRNVQYNVNRNLKILGAKLALPHPLTMYVARHSWASAARTQGIPLSIISEGMGHTSEATTRIYLASLDTCAVDNANALIIASL